MPGADFQFGAVVQPNARDAVSGDGRTADARQWNDDSRRAVDAVDEITRSQLGDRPLAYGRRDRSVRGSTDGTVCLFVDPDAVLTADG